MEGEKTPQQVPQIAFRSLHTFLLAAEGTKSEGTSKSVNRIHSLKKGEGWKLFAKPSHLRKKAPEEIKMERLRADNEEELKMLKSLTHKYPARSSSWVRG